MTWNSPVVLIGWDAATWDVMNPLLARGQLPNIARLMSEGSWGPSQSFLNYTSPSLWTSIITGKLPAKHGVLGFYGATRHHLQCETLYTILAGNSGKIGLFRWFATWPPPENAGFTLPSSIARSPKAYPSQLEFLNSLVHPKGLSSYAKGGLGLLRHGGRFGTLARCLTEALFQAVVRPEYRDWLLRSQLLEARIYGDVFAHLVRRHQPEFAAILFSVIDSFGHQYWKYRQPELFGDVDPADAQRYGQVVDSAYIMADQALGVILTALPKDALVVVASDHGQQPCSTLNRPYLMTEELLRRLSFRNRVFLTHLGYKTLIQSQSTENQADTLHAFVEALDQVRLDQGDIPVFRIIERTNTQLEVEVALGTDTPPETLVTVPDGKPINLGDVVFSRNVSGDHAEWGVLVLKGPGVKRGYRFDTATILDITPTILALRKYPIAKDMDGQVLLDTIEPAFLLENPIRFTQSYESEEHVDREILLGPEEQEALEARLRGLGYL